VLSAVVRFYQKIGEKPEKETQTKKSAPAAIQRRFLNSTMMYYSDLLFFYLNTRAAAGWANRFRGANHSIFTFSSLPLRTGFTYALNNFFSLTGWTWMGIILAHFNAPFDILSLPLSYRTLTLDSLLTSAGHLRIPSLIVKVSIESALSIMITIYNCSFSHPPQDA